MKRAGSRRRTRKKKTMLAKRPFRQLQNPFPPLEVLDEEAVQLIHTTSLDLLEETGLEMWDAEARAILREAGAEVDEAAERVRFPRDMVETAVSQAPSQFTLHARNPAKNLTIGGRNGHIAFGAVGGPPFVTDGRRGRHEATIGDLHTFNKLIHVSDVLTLGGGHLVEPSDLPRTTAHLDAAYADVVLTDKAGRGNGLGRQVTEDSITMWAIGMADSSLTTEQAMAALQERVVLMTVINANSPLRYDGEMLQGLMALARNRQAPMITPFILAGAMSPVSMPSAVMQQNAEVLGGITLAQTVSPGCPVVYGGFVSPLDLQSGATSFGTPEGSWAQYATAQMARFYEVPLRSVGCLTTAHAADAQAAYESLFSLMPAVLARTPIITQAAGWLDGGLTASFEKFVLDVQLLELVAGMCQLPQVTPDSFILDDIKAVGPGGHHLGTANTIENFRSAFYRAPLSTRMSYEAWAETGQTTTAVRATERWQALLKGYKRPFIDPGVDEALQAYMAQQNERLS
ncbi:MAG: trimethylamine methyltransferase family protein [Chloroflexota bacterium]